MSDQTTYVIELLTGTSAKLDPSSLMPSTPA